MNGFRHRVARVLGHIAVVIGILAVIAAAFALSYDAVRDIARAAGVPVTLARIYPGILDAVFLVACAAALMLRDARWWTRLYTWLSVLVTGGLIGAADAYHSMGLKLPHRTTAGTIAALPWVLVMLAFSLWLSMLRHSRSAATAPSPELAPAAPDETTSPALALAASPTPRAALPAPAPDPTTEPSKNNMEGQSPENPPAAEVPTPKGPEDPPVEAGPAHDTTEPMDTGSTDVAANPPPAKVATAESPKPGTEAAHADTEPVNNGSTAAQVITAESPKPGPDTAVAPGTTEVVHNGTAAAANPPAAEVTADESPKSGPDTAADPATAEAVDTGTAGSAASHPAAEVTADESPDGRAPETGAPAEPSGRADAGPDDGDAADDEVLGDRQDAPSAPARPHPSDADTPPYGFPAVTEQDVAAAQNGSRMPTLLSAPVPADVAAAPEAESGEAEPGDVAAKGRPPAASPELSGTQAELAHEDQPAKKPPTPFERVRSTPTRPAAPQPEEDGAA